MISDYKKKEATTVIKNIIGLMGIVGLASIPLMIHGIESGSTDLFFHLWRIEAIKENLQMGVFPVKMYGSYMQGKGYAAGVFYPDLFLYLPALLRMLGVTIVRAYKILLIVMNAMTAIIAYRVAKYILNHDGKALLIAFVWTTCNYRMEDVYNRAALGESLALTFYPLLIGAIFILAYEIGRDYQRRSICWLVVGASGVIESHILSTEMIIIFLILMCLFNLKYILKREKIRVIFISALSTLSLNAGFLVPFLQYMITEKVSVVSYGIQQIQMQGLKLKNILPYVDTEITVLDGSISTTQPKTLGYSLLAIGCICVITVLGRKKKDYTDKQIRLLVLGFVGTFMASRYFPYDFLCAHIGVFNKLLGTIQFPWRWLGCASAILVFSFIWFLYKEKNYTLSVKNVVIGIVLLSCVISVTSKSYEVIMYAKQNNAISYFEKTSELPQESIYQIMGGEYLPVKARVNGQMFSMNEYNEPDVMKGWQKVDDEYHLTVDVKEEQDISVPIWYYSGYRAWDIQGNDLEVKCGDDGYLQIKLTASYTGEIVIQYVEPWYWRVAELLSLITVILFSGWIYRSGKRQ